MARATILGTSWPVPHGWSAGDLLDPARCEAGTESFGGRWRLVETPNGVCVSGRYRQGGAEALTYVARGDTVPDTDWLLTDVQAVYVVRPQFARILDEIQSQLEMRVIAENDYGTLDGGHAAMGPIPMNTWWRVPGEEANEPPYRALTSERVAMSLVGGGFVTLFDAQKCCGVLLEPLPWRAFSIERAREAMRATLPGIDVRGPVARVWNRVLADGCSYEANAPDRRDVGALWADAFGQSWHLRYVFGGPHAREIEDELRAAIDLHTA